MVVSKILSPAEPKETIKVVLDGAARLNPRQAEEAVDSMGMDRRGSNSNSANGNRRVTVVVRVAVSWERTDCELAA
jgi:hypothetical protein